MAYGKIFSRVASALKRRKRAAAPGRRKRRSDSPGAAGYAIGGGLVAAGLGAHSGSGMLWAKVTGARKAYGRKAYYAGAVMGPAALPVGLTLAGGRAIGRGAKRSLAALRGFRNKRRTRR